MSRNSSKNAKIRCKIYVKSFRSSVVSISRCKSLKPQNRKQCVSVSNMSFKNFTGPKHFMYAFTVSIRMFHYIYFNVGPSTPYSCTYFVQAGGVKPIQAAHRNRFFKCAPNGVMIFHEFPSVEAQLTRIKDFRLRTFLALGCDLLKQTTVRRFRLTLLPEYYRAQFCCDSKQTLNPIL